MAVILQNQYVDIVIADTGFVLHLVERATESDYAVHTPASPFIRARQGDRDLLPEVLTYVAGTLRVGFAGGGRAAIRVTSAARYFLFEVIEAEGAFDELHIVNLPTTLRVAADEPFSACTLGLNLRTNVEALPGPQQHLWAACYQRFGFVGALVGLVACPYAEMREVLKEVVAAAPEIPHSPLGGPWAMDRDEPRGSYLFGRPTEDTVDQWIALCRELNFTQIDFCGCLNYGDYQPFAQLYPNGYDSVRAVTDRLHDAGILAGLHTMSFSISKQCDWVTPRPDPRLAKERTYTLAGDLDADSTEVLLQESTTELPRHVSYHVRRSMTLQIDDELIQYAVVTDAGLGGCIRGACGTTPSAHARGAAVHHLKECWGCFLPDGESTLFAAVAERIAAVITTCGFDFTYLDGLDGAHVIGGEENRWHYGAKFAFAVYERLQRPIMMEMATFHHHLWYVRSRMQAWDHAIRGHKTFIDLHCRSNEGCRRMFMPRHLGWSRVLAWVDTAHEPTFDDDVEYMWGKGLAHDAGYSLQVVTPEMVAAEPWVKQVTPIIRTYETLRRENYFPEAVKRELRRPGSEFTLRQAPDGEWEFQPRQYHRHRVEGLDTPSRSWITVNEFESQPLQLRIQALMSAAPYDDPGNLVLADFRQSGEFADREATSVILNSGKVYTYPAAAPGLWAEITPSSAPQVPGGICGCWRADNEGSGEAVASSSPLDELSLLDHAEKIYRPRRASWVRLGKRFPVPLDLGERRALAFWICGDAQNELISLSLGSPGELDTEQFDYYLPVDFSGWRYVELIEPESARSEQASWPYGRCLYKQYRTRLDVSRIGRLTLWYNNVPEGGTVRCLLSPIKAVPLVSGRICRPSVRLGERSITFPVELESGSYLEYFGADRCRVYGPKRELLGEVTPVGEAPILEQGANHLHISCAPSTSRVRAQVTVITCGDTPLRR